MPDFSHEINYGRNAGKAICGVDEVGRGPLAGPVVAAAVVLPIDCPDSIVTALRDSKKMSEKAREALFQPLCDLCPHAITEASVAEIDTINILQASMLAMQRAVAALDIKIDVALIDGNRAPQINCQPVTIIKGDDKSYSIAAASIIAKVYRDRLMKKLAIEFPSYGWEHNAGYGTATHMAALDAYGVTPWHRTSFAPVRERMRKSA